MAHSLKSAGDSVFATSSAAPTGSATRPIGARERRPGAFDKLTSVELLEKLTWYLVRMRDDTRTAYSAVLRSHEADACPQACLETVECRLTDQCWELSARDVVRELAKRARQGGFHA